MWSQRGAGFGSGTWGDHEHITPLREDYQALLAMKLRPQNSEMRGPSNSSTLAQRN